MSPTYSITYYNGYGYNFFYGAYGYYEYSVNPTGEVASNTPAEVIICCVLFIAFICLIVCIIKKRIRGGYDSDIYDEASFHTDTREQIVVEETKVVTHLNQGLKITAGPPVMGDYDTPGYTAPGNQPVTK